MREEIRRKVVETKRNLILEEVSPLFEAEGFSSLKMQEIAKRLGMSVGALYKMFESKEALYYAYIAFQIRRFHERLLRQCAGTEDPEASLRCYIRLKFDAFRTKRKAIEDPVVGDPLFFLKMNTHRDNPAHEIFEYLAQQFEALDSRQPLKEKDHRKTAYLFNAFTTGYIEHWIQHGSSLEESEEKVLSEFLYGMLQGGRE